jgi:hypothetical protein
MKNYLKNIILFFVVAIYFFGTAGFSIHHCCCKKSYHTTCAIFNSFNPYIEHDCIKYQEHISADKILKYRQSRHCGEFIFSKLTEKYNNEKCSHLSEVDSQVVSEVLIPIIKPLLRPPFSAEKLFNLVKKRRWQESNISLCIFRI